MPQVGDGEDPRMDRIARMARDAVCGHAGSFRPGARYCPEDDLVQVAAKDCRLVRLGNGRRLVLFADSTNCRNADAVALNIIAAGELAAGLPRDDNGMVSLDGLIEAAWRADALPARDLDMARRLAEALDEKAIPLPMP